MAAQSSEMLVFVLKFYQYMYLTGTRTVVTYGSR
jgi:hypothetical protein